MCKSSIPSYDVDLPLIQAMTAANVPGAALLCIQNGQIKSIKTYGLADPKSGRPVTTNTLFTVASLSKTVTATALMILYEKGKFTLDDDVSMYLPFKLTNPHFPDQSITCRMLLSHTSTILDSHILYKSYTLHQTPVLPDSPIPLGEYLMDYLSFSGKLYKAEDNFLNASPGSTYKYSNTGFALIGYLIECISGMPFDAYCKQAIFEPLCMKHTAWHFKEVDLNQMAIPYGYDHALSQPICHGFYGYPTYPDGTLKTSVIEFAHFLSLFINDGKTFDGTPLLQSETVKEMLAHHPVSEIHTGKSIGLAWRFDGSFYWYNGVDPGISTLAQFDPVSGQGVILFTNGSNFDARVQIKSAMA